jgi:hypothetical protein
MITWRTRAVVSLVSLVGIVLACSVPALAQGRGASGRRADPPSTPVVAPAPHEAASPDPPAGERTLVCVGAVSLASPRCRDRGTERSASHQHARRSPAANLATAGSLAVIDGGLRPGSLDDTSALEGTPENPGGRGALGLPDCLGVQGERCLDDPVKATPPPTVSSHAPGPSNDIHLLPVVAAFALGVVLVWVAAN